MAEEKVQITPPIKRAGCFEGDRSSKGAKCVRGNCSFEEACMWKKDASELSPNLGGMPENRKVILSR